MNRLATALSAALLLCLAGDTAAQVFVNPFVGTTLTSPYPGGAHSKPGFGLVFGKLGDVVGLESEIAFYPELLDSAARWPSLPTSSWARPSAVSRCTARPGPATCI